MRWLPTIVLGSVRVALPRSSAIEPHLMRAMVDIAAPRRLSIERLAGAIASDPPLAIFATQIWIESIDASVDGAGPPTSVTTETLAHVLADQLARRFCDNRQPRVRAEASSIQRRVTELRSSFASIPRVDWLRHADQWFALSHPIHAKMPAGWDIDFLVPDDRDSPDDARDGDDPNESIVKPRVDEIDSDLLTQVAIQSRDLRQLRHHFAERLDHQKRLAIGQLAYGLSHEINNPLANISTRAESLLRQVDLGDNHREVLRKIVDQSYRAFGMIADLMFYARPPQPQVQAFDVGELLAEVVTEFVDREPSLAVRCQSSKLCIDGDRTMLGEAIRVVLQNAFEATMPTGLIDVSMTVENDQVKIVVADSGPGLTDEARQHALDPYFSGREAGRGLGMGLCRATRILQLHRGRIEVGGGPVGCVVTLEVPRCIASVMELARSDE